MFYWAVIWDIQLITALSVEVVVVVVVVLGEVPQVVLKQFFLIRVAMERVVADTLVGHLIINPYILTTTLFIALLLNRSKKMKNLVFLAPFLQ
jgi:hypothetical protein